MTTDAAAVVALALLAVFGVLGFGWRAWLQRRRTGSTGVRGLRGRVGWAESVAGLGFVIVLIAAMAGPVVQLSGVLTPVGVLGTTWIQVVGIVLAVLGIGAMIWAQIDMGDSWRIGVDESEITALVRTGVFRRVRNPIYTAMGVFALGITLLTPNVVAVLTLVLAVVTLELQVRRVEEPYLLGKHGDAYRAYQASVGRFLPGVGLIR